MIHRFSRRLAIWAMLACVFSLSGCSGKGSAEKTYTRKGEVKSIDLNNRKVVLSFMKGGSERELPGTYTDETVVIINGRNMTVKDIQEGDKVEVVGRKEGKGTDAVFIATRVTVSRNEGDWQTTGKGGKSASDDKSTAHADEEG